MSRIAPAEIQNLLNEGFEYCPDCDGTDHGCGLCGGDGVVFASESEHPALFVGVDMGLAA